MVVIRLALRGRNKRPFYHIVVTDQRKPRDSGEIEKLGYYNSLEQDFAQAIHVNQERVAYWRSCGAQLSDRVSYLLKKHDKLLGVKVKSSAKVNDDKIKPANPTLTATDDNLVTA